MDEKNLSLYGTGEDQRAFTFVEDLNQLLEKFIEERLISWSDYELLIRISIKCKAIKTGEKLTLWKD